MCSPKALQGEVAALFVTTRDRAVWFQRFENILKGKMGKGNSEKLSTPMKLYGRRLRIELQ
jgi:hypothetical protein